MARIKLNIENVTDTIPYSVHGIIIQTLKYPQILNNSLSSNVFFNLHVPFLKKN